MGHRRCRDQSLNAKLCSPIHRLSPHIPTLSPSFVTTLIAARTRSHTHIQRALPFTRVQTSRHGNFRDVPKASSTFSCHPCRPEVVHVSTHSSRSARLFILSFVSFCFFFFSLFFILFYCGLFCLSREACQLPSSRSPKPPFSNSSSPHFFLTRDSLDSLRMRQTLLSFTPIGTRRTT